MGNNSTLNLLLTFALLWILIGGFCLAFMRNFFVVSKVLFPVGAMFGVAIGLISWMFLGGDAAIQTTVLKIGLPTLPFHFRLDSLSAIFITLLGFTATGISIYSSGYFRDSVGAPVGLLGIEYHIFLASMLLVLLADDAYAFMVSWELMALSSFLLVTTDHRFSEIRRAAYLYLLIAHIGAIAILLGFGVMTANSGDYTFEGMRLQTLTPFWSSIAFLLALFGFGAKAGIVPLHIWLPQAHPAAPSPVSALMSAVMLKIAIYGLLRVSFDLLVQPLWWWGVLAMAVGLITALLGVLYSCVQKDMKRLLAYSSIENIGLMFVGIGLTLMFYSFNMSALSALSLTAVIYHALAHSAFKSILFLCTGSVLHATSERSLGKLGGLIRRMPWVAWIALIGIIAGSGLPPLSGFIGEWMLLQAFLFSPGLPNNWLNMIVPIAAAVVVLVAALAGFAMVKFYGIVFLGQMREAKLQGAKDAGLFERLGLIWLVLLTFILGIFPNTIISHFNSVNIQLLGMGLGSKMSATGWWQLAPISEERASYIPVLFLLFILFCAIIVRILLTKVFTSKIKRVRAWDCGYNFQSHIAQDTAEGFSQPIRRIFANVFRINVEIPTAHDPKPVFRIKVEEHLWYWLYLPIVAIVDFISKIASRIQGGRIAIYLLYSFVTLIFLLLTVSK